MPRRMESCGGCRRLVQSATSGLQGLQLCLQGLQALVHPLHQRTSSCRDGRRSWRDSLAEMASSASRRAVIRPRGASASFARLHASFPCPGLGRVRRRHPEPAAPRPKVIGRGVMVAGSDVGARRHTRASGRSPSPVRRRRRQPPQAGPRYRVEPPAGLASRTDEMLLFFRPCFVTSA
jgi:hypothetical protein